MAQGEASASWTKTPQEDIAALKRLLREVFAELEATKQRLHEVTTKLEDEKENGEVNATPRGARSRSKAKVRWTGELHSQSSWPLLVKGGQAGRALSFPSSCGDAMLYLHSVWDEKHRLTAKLQCPGTRTLLELGRGASGAQTNDGVSGPAELHQLVYRCHPSPRWHFMLAPIGGCLEAVTPPMNPFPAPAFHPLHEGHQHGWLGTRQPGAGLGATA